MAKSKTAVVKPKTRKSQREVSDSNLHKRLQSDRISDDVDAFEKAGGRVEVLGTTRVLQKIGDGATG